MNRIDQAAAELRAAEDRAAATGDPEDGHRAAVAYCRLVAACNAAAAGWGEVLADAYMDEPAGADDLAGLLAGARA